MSFRSLRHKFFSIERLFVLFLFLVLFCLLTPIYHQKKADVVNQSKMNDYKKTTAQIDSSIYESPKNDNYDSSFHSIQEIDGVLGSLEFPTVQLIETPIYKKNNNHAFFYYSAKPYDISTIIFNNQWKSSVHMIELIQLKIGECFYLRTGQQRRMYQIIEMTTIEPQIVDKVISKDHYLIIELENVSSFTDKKITIISKIVAKKNVDSIQCSPKFILNYQTIVIALLSLNTLFFSGLVLTYQRYIKKVRVSSLRVKTIGYKKLKFLLQFTRGYYILLWLIMCFYLSLLIYREIYLR